VCSCRFTRFLLYLGYSASDAGELKVQAFCRTVSAFAMEYRTAREKLVQQRQKAASQQARKGSRALAAVDVIAYLLIYFLLHFLRYGNSADNAVEENSSVFSGRSQLLARWPGTHSRILSGIQRSAQTVLGVYLKRTVFARY